LPPSPPTKTRILDAAERCFAEHGYRATSLRAVTTAARVNLAAVSYHFGGKEDLFVEVLARRIGPINDERLAGLDQLEARYPRGRLPLEQVLDVFLRPALRLVHTQGGARLLRLVARMYVETPPRAALFQRRFEEVKRRFVAALRRALPGLALDGLFWRAHFMVGAMLHTMRDTHRLKDLSQGLCDPSDPDTVLRELVPFVAAGLRARRNGR
jgi:AcrR family transcriptional regulator